MNKISSVILLLLITVSLGMPQQYDDEYGEYDEDETAAYYEEEPNINAPAAQTVFKYKSQTLTVTEGENVDLSCETQTPKDDVIIFKKLNGSRSKDEVLYIGGLKVDRRTSFINENSVFKLKNVKRTDGGTYICYYQGDSGELIFKLDVRYPPTVKAKTPLKQRVEKGDSVTVECEANGNPTPTIKWSKESGRLPSGNQEEMGYSMTLENVDRHVEGTYICTADNGIGEPASTSMKLTVEYPPEITTEKHNESTNLPIVTLTIPVDDVSSSGKASPTTTTTIATSTTYPLFTEEKGQYPHEETMSLHKTGGADFASLNTVLLILSFLVLSLNS